MGEQAIEAPAVVLVTHQSRPWIERLFGGTVDVARRLETTVIAVDNASTDGTVELLREWERRSNRVRVLAMGRNLGYAGAVNAAFSTAPDGDVLLINPDVELSDAESVRELSRFLAQHPLVGAVGPRLLGSLGDVQDSARRFPTPAAVAGSLTSAGRLRILRRSRERYTAPSNATTPTSVDWVLGAAMLIRREAYDAVGGWDDRFFLYVEDADFCRRLRRAGWDVTYHPEISLHHAYARESSAADASVLSSVARRRHIASFVRFWARDPLALIGRSPARVR